MIGYYRSLVGNPSLTRNIGEWAPPSLRNPFSWGFFTLLVAMLAAVAVSHRRGLRPDPVLGWLSVALLAEALTGLRFQAWFAFAATLLAADTQVRTGPGVPIGLRPAFTRATAGVLGLLAVTSLAVLALTPDSQFESVNGRQTVDVAAAIAARTPRAHILSDESFVAQLLWLHPATIGRVAFSASVEDYSSGQITPFFKFLHRQGPSWQRITRGYGIIVVSNQDPGLAVALCRLPQWRAVYADSNGLVLQRRAP